MPPWRTLENLPGGPQVLMEVVPFRYPGAVPAIRENGKEVLHGYAKGIVPIQALVLANTADKIRSSYDGLQQCGRGKAKQNPQFSAQRESIDHSKLSSDSR